MLKEGLQAYLMQRVAPEPMTLSPAQMLYLATRAGAEALESGTRPAISRMVKRPIGLPLRRLEQRSCRCFEGAEDPEQILAALFTLAGAESVGRCGVADDVVFAWRD